MEIGKNITNTLPNFYLIIFFQPLMWEYIWCISLLLSFLGLAAVRKNRIKAMKRYMIGICIFGFGPILYAAVYYFTEAWQYISSGETEDITLWQVSFPSII